MVDLPALFSNIPRYPLSYNHASPIHPLPNLTKTTDTSSNSSPPIQLWAKREDQAGPLPCCGNKYRKFEYLVPDILKQGETAESKVTMLVSEGGIQSNSTVEVAALARVLGLECLVMLHKGIGGWRASKDPDAYLRTGNVQANELLGAEVRITEENDTGGAEGPLLPVMEELRAMGKVPYWVPPGASLHPLGGLGYARCAFEIVQQEQDMTRNQLKGSSRFDYIFVPCGSGSTFAGMIAGFKLIEKFTPSHPGRPQRQIIGVMNSPTKPIEYHQKRILGIAQTAAKLIGLDPETDILPEDVRIDDRFAGVGYGILDGDTKRTLEIVSRTDAMFLDPVYTAKVMRGMLAWAEGGEMQKDYLSKLSSLGGQAEASPQHLNALFLHTGGQGVLSAYSDVMSPN